MLNQVQHDDVAARASPVTRITAVCSDFRFILPACRTGAANDDDFNAWRGRAFRFDGWEIAA